MSIPPGWAERTTLSRRRLLARVLPRAVALLALPGVLGVGRSASAALGSATAPQGGGGLNLARYALDNGLEVILVEDHTAPTVAVDVWYRVGAADDPPGRSGFAHLFEHMMFEGSANVPPGRHAELISAAGGNSNATTALDRTNYF